MDEDDSFEKYPGNSIEKAGERNVPEAQDFAKSFENGVPEFAGDSSNVLGNHAEGETAEDDANYDNDIANAAALINYGLDAASRELGVERTVQLIKTFDPTGSENPIKDLFEYLGIDTDSEREDVFLEAKASKTKEMEFREESGIPRTIQRSNESALKAIEDMKELIIEVEGADPRYAELRDKAKTAGKGYFEYAVSNFETRGLTELFSVLAEQREEKAPDDTEPEDGTISGTLSGSKIISDSVPENDVTPNVDAENRLEK